MYDLIDHDRGHLSKHDEVTGKKYPDVQSVVDSIEFPENPNRLRFGIWDGDVLVGSINLTPIQDRKWKTGEVGYWIGAEHVRKGYASKALGLIIDFAFQAHEYAELIAEIHPDNVGSRRTVEANGFVEVGVTGVGSKKHLVYQRFSPSAG